VGVDVDRAHRRIFVAASLLTGAAVAMAGPIGFVGIVVPHALRSILGPDHRALLPASALAGAAFLVAADTLARLAFLVAGTEPTVGVLTALAGAPFFLIVLRRRGAARMF
jgi:iron complex transport system permease protein